MDTNILLRSDHSTFFTESSVYSFRTMLYIWKLNGRKQSIEVAAELVMIHSYRVGYRTDNESIIFFSLFFMLLCCDKICQQINVMRMTNGMNESTATNNKIHSSFILVVATPSEYWTIAKPIQSIWLSLNIYIFIILFANHQQMHPFIEKQTIVIEQWCCSRVDLWNNDVIVGWMRFVLLSSYELIYDIRIR